MTGSARPLPSQPFGQTSHGRAATLYTLQNDRLRVQITDFGGRMVRIQAPDRHGHLGDVLLGFDNVEAYRTNGGAFGALLGRSANRIAGASVTIDGQRHTLSRNNGEATLHGGAVGFDKVFWTASITENGAAPRLVFTHTSADGDQGFPGEVTAQATYHLIEDQLILSFEARTTKTTIVNLSAHPYFNLAGTADVLGHEVMIGADLFLPTDAAQIPTGVFLPVHGTAFDFRQPVLLGRGIWHADPQLFFGLGYDHCFVLGTDIPPLPRLAARIREPNSGRVLEIHTDQPGLQMYTGNKLTGAFAGHGGVIYRQSSGVALEAQGFPDAPNHANFPSTLLTPGTVYKRIIRYRLTAD